MKNPRLYILFSFMMFSCASFVHSQNNEKQVIESLKKFYTAYNKAWAKKSAPRILISELDSLHQIYCTVKLRAELKKLFKEQGLDHDIFTNDYGTDYESMKSLEITKDATKTNGYIVSYFVKTEDAVGREIKKKVIVRLSLKKENGSFKINDVR